MESFPSKPRSRFLSELSCKSQVREMSSFLGLPGFEEGLDVSVLLNKDLGMDGAVGQTIFLLLVKSVL